MNLSGKFAHLFVAWLPFAVLATVLSLLVFVAVQQDIRHAADNPQIQISGDIAAAMTAGQTPQGIVGGNQPIDISKSMATFVIFYDASGTPISGTGYLNGNLPKIPAGTLAVAKANGQNKVTWQPQTGVRIASVIVPYSGPASGAGFVLVGRSLAEPETREARAEQEAIGAWIAALVLTFITVAFSDYVKAKLLQTSGAGPVVVIEEELAAFDDNDAA